MKSQFISSSYIYKYTVIESNVDADVITKFINQAQELNIQSTLGSHLYNKLVNDCPNFTGYYLTLVRDYIQPAQAEWTVYYALPWINFHLTNKAVSVKSTDSSAPSTIDDLKWLRSQVKDSAEFYAERIKDYIKNNQSQFPEFYTTESGQPFDIKANRTNYKSGIFTTGKGYQAPLPPLNQIDRNDFLDC